jgi:carboxypeptidase PM20D1
MVKRIALALLATLLGLALVLGVNTWRQGSRQLIVAPIAVMKIDEMAAGQRLAQAVRLPTISSHTEPALNADQFRALHQLLEKNFPLVHRQLKREVIGGSSLLYTWVGKQTQLKPIALLAHQDVVPIAPGTEKDWAHPPFSGEIKDGFVWGRGAWDNKGNLLAQMEAVELLLAGGYQPERTVYLVMGADEEVGGLRGAKVIAQTLKQRGVNLELVIDEGLLITEGIMPGLAPPTALIGIAEKGYLSVVLNFSGKPGHSSMPPPKGDGAIAMMSAGLKRLNDDQFPAAIRGVAAEMFATIAPEMSGFSRVALSNLWLFGPIVQRQLEAAASTNATLRTTTALTMVSAGNKDNVIPGNASATVNLRLLPGDSAADVTQRIREKVQSATGDAKFEVLALAGGSEASPVSPTEGWAYHLVNKSIREVFPGTLVSPGLMVAATDSRHFTDISRHIYRFSPVRAKPEDLSRFHGTNERISLANHAELIRFYHRLIGEGALAAAP